MFRYTIRRFQEKILYNVLSIKSDFTTQELQTSYRKLIKKYHPDNPMTGSRLTFDSVQKAHDILSNTKLRQEYESQSNVDHNTFNNLWKQEFDPSKEYGKQLMTRVNKIFKFNDNNTLLLCLNSL